jgi:hypothetical protein
MIMYSMAVLCSYCLCLSVCWIALLLLALCTSLSHSCCCLLLIILHAFSLLALLDETYHHENCYEYCFPCRWWTGKSISSIIVCLLQIDSATFCLMGQIKWLSKEVMVRLNYCVNNWTTMLQVMVIPPWWWLCFDYSIFHFSLQQADATTWRKLVIYCSY